MSGAQITIIVVCCVLLSCVATALLFYCYFKKKYRAQLTSWEKDKLNRFYAEMEEKRREILDKATAEAKQYTEGATLFANNAEERVARLRAEYDKLQHQMEDYRADMDAKRRASLEESKAILQSQLKELNGMAATRIQTLLDQIEEYEERKNEASDAMEYERQLLLNIQARKLAELNGEEVGFRIHLSAAAVKELKELWDVIGSLNIGNPAPLYKAVFEMYLRAPVKMMLNDPAVVGGGIYRITDLTTARIYIGKSVNFENRWLEHIKRGSYFEEGTAAGSGLYGAMKEHGVWNFRFEIVETIDDTENRSLLSEREKYWIEFYESDKTGLNLRRG